MERRREKMKRGREKMKRGREKMKRGREKMKRGRGTSVDCTNESVMLVYHMIEAVLVITRLVPRNPLEIQSKSGDSLPFRTFLSPL